jgi:hypothetical protein
VKGARPTPIRVEDGRRLGGLTHVGAELGVGGSQVDAWRRRRDANGFPEPVRRGPVTGHADAELYDLDECARWRETYVPRRGVPLRLRSKDPNRKGAADIARALGVPPRRVFGWTERRATNGCPQPGADGLYDEGEWRAWLAARQAVTR